MDLSLDRGDVKASVPRSEDAVEIKADHTPSCTAEVFRDRPAHDAEADDADCF